MLLHALLFYTDVLPPQPPFMIPFHVDFSFDAHTAGPNPIYSLRGI